MVEQLIAIFCDVDDFCKGYEEYCKTHLLMDKDHIAPKTSMALSEIMTIVIFFHMSGYRCYQHSFRTVLLFFYNNRFNSGNYYFFQKIFRIRIKIIIN